MGKANRGRSERVDGLVLLNKPAGVTSNQALQKVKRLLNASKAGHTGSLDPAATGMLPLCFGEATKVCAYLLDADKTYRVQAKLGSQTDTGDATGKLVATTEVPDRSPGEWAATLSEFLGASTQIPPMYSALKKDGRRLYELARKGEIVERAPRPIRIDAIELLEAAGTRVVFRVRCSKGTYIRTLVEDMAERAGTLAHTARLHRETVGELPSDEMIDLDTAVALAEAGQLRQRLLPPDQALMALPEVRVDGDEIDRFRGGQAAASTASDRAGLARVYGDNAVFLGVGELIGDGRVAPRRVFGAASGESPKP